MISPISNRRLSQALCETLDCEIPVSTGAQVIAHPVWLHDDGALALRAARVWLDHTHILREAVMARSAKAILGGTAKAALPGNCRRRGAITSRSNKTKRRR